MPVRLFDIYFLAARELMARPYTKMLDSDCAKKKQTNRYKHKRCPEKHFRYVTVFNDQEETFILHKLNNLFFHISVLVRIYTETRLNKKAEEAAI